MPLINRLYFRFKDFLASWRPKLYHFCEARKSIIKFFCSGTLAATVDLVALFIFHGLLGWDIVVATSVAFIFSFAVSFTLQKLWTFRNYSQQRLPRQLMLYFGFAFITMYFNGLGMHTLVNKIGIWYLFSQIIVNVALGIFNFVSYKFIVFRKTVDEN